MEWRSRLFASVRIAIMAVACVPFATSVAAQDCTALLRHGIYNSYNVRESSRSRNVFFSELCSQQSTIESTKLGVTIPVEGVPINLDFGTASSLARASCATEYRDAEAKNDREMLIRRLSDQAVGAWSQCVQAAQDGLKYKPKIVPLSGIGFGGTKTIVMDVDYVIGPGRKPMTIKAVREDGFTCSGSLKQRVNRQVTPGETLSLNCERTVSRLPQTVAGNLIYAPAASITVNTDVGSILLSEPAVQATPTLEELTARIADLERRLDGTKLEYASGDIEGIRYSATQVLAYQFGRGSAGAINTGQPFVPGEVPVMIGVNDGTGAGVHSYNYYRLLRLTIPPPQK